MPEQSTSARVDLVTNSLVNAIPPHVLEKLTAMSRRPIHSSAPLFHRVLEGDVTSVEPGDEISMAIFEIEMINEFHTPDCRDLETACVNISFDDLQAIFNGRWLRFERSQGFDRFRSMTEGDWDRDIDEGWASGINRMSKEVENLRSVEEAVEARIVELEKDGHSTRLTTLLHEWRCRQIVWRLDELRICISDGFDAFRLAHELGNLPWQLQI